MDEKNLMKNLMAEEQHGEGRNPDGCKDGGTCHHDCRGGCFREKTCVPLACSNLDDNWEPLTAGNFQNLRNEKDELTLTLSRTKEELEEAIKLLSQYELIIEMDGGRAIDEIEKLHYKTQNFLAEHDKE